jgi:hypothetical protein
VSLEVADNSERSVQSRQSVTKKGNFSPTPGLPDLGCFHFTERECR